MADIFSRAVNRDGEGLLTLPFKPDELYRVPTDDGAAIALGRYHAREQRRYAEPVILCHGLGANRFHMDFDEHYSLARYLARAGYETWVMELRGRGLAGPCGDATFDDQAEHDVRTALRTVLSTGAKQVLWVGHSKGGLTLYGHLARNPQAPVRAAVAIGSPFTFAVQPGLKTFIQKIEPLLRLKMIPTRRITGIALFGAPPGPLSRYMMLASNMEPDVVRKALANVPADIYGGVVRQFAHWIATDSFCMADGTCYRKPLAGVKLPVMLVAGSKDLLAPPLAVARAQEHLGGPVKLVVAGRGHGFAEDYGHADLVLGRRAPDEIFPLVEAFLSAHATRA
ncbi:MAG TPA: alpha/beta fold hydrolase [Archangium sp.]|uniref:alpha/beta hydrolase n=1 Tax=Archangium sp. TaxID=1872627 RepID=UPI002E3189D9|nr:alpha/beta fold hydrolase [Archangium sp.]HEX5744686.1 alpha/beta fold hydrolase [Archangium sp.]